MKTLAILALLVSLVGCSNTPKVVYVESKPYQFMVAPKVPKVTIRVHTGDAVLYNKYIDTLQGRIIFYEDQITRYLISNKAD